METGRYETGLDPYLDVITAQLTLLGSQQAQVTLHVNEMTAAVELIQALGGGWKASELPEPSKIRSDAAVRQVQETP
jgi:outer membrane protein TolC